MKIKHIYITKEGEPMANPEMEYPGDINPSTSTVNDVNQFNKYHSGLLPFEDREKALKKCYTKDEDYDDPVFPGDVVPVDLEVEVVEQHRINEGEWIPGILTQDPVNRTDAYEYRQALRIKP